MMELLRDLAPIDAFPTVDEMHAFAARLASDHAELVTRREVGRSRAGDSIELLSIGASTAGPSVLVVGMPHPNEPIGMATIVAMCERLVADPGALEATGATWHFIPCVDPDGTRLNEGWFAGPWTREHYARHFFRPGGEAQVEWTFPFSADDFSVNAPMPETEALMTAIDEVRPRVLASLHNAELGGAYYYVSEGDDRLYAQLIDLCTAHGVPLHRGEPETPLSAELAPAVYSIPRTSQLYEFVVSAGMDPAGVVTGGSSQDWAERHGPVAGLAIELPYWRDHRATDPSPVASGESRRDVVLRGLDLQESMYDTIRALYDAAAPLPPSLLTDAVISWLGTADTGFTEAERKLATESPDFDRTATVAEAFSAANGVHMLRLRLAGMFLRALAADSPDRADAERTFAEWCAEAEADNQAEAIPIADLVVVQGGAILAVASHALSR